MSVNIGIKVKEPERECEDEHCPFHGKLSVRGKLFDGKVTSVIKHHFDEVYATEQSPSMRWRLQDKGFK